MRKLAYYVACSLDVALRRGFRLLPEGDGHRSNLRDSHILAPHGGSHTEWLERHPSLLLSALMRGWRELLQSRRAALHRQDFA